MFQEKVVKKIKSHILFSLPFFSEICAVFEIWEINVDPNWPQIILRRMRNVRFITQATDSHSERVLRIGFPLQRCLHKRATILRLYVHCLFRTFDIPSIHAQVVTQFDHYRFLLFTISSVFIRLILPLDAMYLHSVIKLTSRGIECESKLGV